MARKTKLSFFPILVSFLTIVVITTTSCGPPHANNANTAANKATQAPGLRPPSCDAGQDDKIHAGLYAGAVDPATGDTDLKVQRETFNYYSKDCKVVLSGYVADLEHFKKLYNLAAKQEGVTAVDISGLYLERAKYPRLPDPEGLCPDGYELCGQICVLAGTCQTNRKVASTPTPKP